MKAGWEVRLLGEVCTIVNGGTPKSNIPAYWGGEVNWLTPKDMGQMDGDHIAETPRKITQDGLANSSARCVPPYSIIMSTRAPIGHLAINEAPMAFNQGCRGMVPSKALEARYLFHFLSANIEQLNELGTGTTFKELSSSALKAFPIPLPPLEEQQRIVAILDEAFEGLARARAHAEANLQNALELFEATLHRSFSVGTENWSSMTVEDSLTRTKVPNKVQRKSYLDAGRFPIVSQEAGLINGYWDNEEDLVRIKRPVVVFGDHTRTLKFVDFDFVVGADGTQIMAPRDELDTRFYYFALKTIDLKGKGYARHFSHLKKCKINFPKDISQQQEIADRLDGLSQHSNMLTAEYSLKSRELDALRQSLLRRAFAGELT